MELREAVEHFGQDSNSFFSLYPGFESEQTPSPPSWIAYVPVSGGKVGISEPFCDDADRIEALAAFFKLQKERKETAFCLPIRKPLAVACRQLHWKVIQIGTEPQFHLPTYMRWHSGDLLSLIPSAKHLSSRGAKVREVPPSKLTAELRQELNHILEDWYQSRKLPPLGFLNRVEPWVHYDQKKLFVLDWQGKPAAFLSALPIPARGGWYFIDLIRRPQTPAGATELLILEAMRIVHSQDYEWVSLGVSPLAGLKDTDFGRFPLLYRILQSAFKYGNFFYGFKSLYEYKLKFQPTHLEPVYLVAPAHEKLSRISNALKEAYFSSSIPEMALFAINRSIRNHLVERWLSAKVRPDLMLKTIPKTLADLFSRTRFSICILALWFFVYLRANNHRGLLPPQRGEPWSFVGAHWIDFSVFHSFKWLEVLAVSPFLHNDRLHVASNSILFFLIAPFAEILLGSRIVALTFVLGCAVGNPIAAFLFEGAVSIGATSFETALLTPDVGGSLGLFAVMGAFFSIFKIRFWLLSAALAGIFSFALSSKNWIHLNHGVALMAGAWVFSWTIRSRKKGD